MEFMFHWILYWFSKEFLRFAKEVLRFAIDFLKLSIDLQWRSYFSYRLYNNSTGITFWEGGLRLGAVFGPPGVSNCVLGAAEGGLRLGREFEVIDRTLLGLFLLGYSSLGP